MSSPPLVSFELPPELVRWRASRGAQAVQLSAGGGVRLLRAEGPKRLVEAVFPTVGAAVAAVAEPERIRWQVVGLDFTGMTYLERRKAVFARRSAVKSRCAQALEVADA